MILREYAAIVRYVILREYAAIVYFVILREYAAIVRCAILPASLLQSRTGLQDIKPELFF